MNRVFFLLFMPVALKFNLCVYTLVEKVGVVVTYPEKGRKKTGAAIALDVCYRSCVLSFFMVVTFLHYLPTVRQFADICLFSTAQYKCTVAELESE